MRSLRSVAIAGTFVFLAAAFPSRTHRSGAIHLALANGSGSQSLGLRRLSLVRPEEPVFQRCAIESADDQIHLFRVRRVDEREALGLLSLRVADHFDIVEDKVFCVEPRLDIVFGNPNRQISEKYGEGHSKVSLTPLSGIWRNCFLEAIHESYTMVSQQIAPGKRKFWRKPVFSKEKKFSEVL